MSPGCYFMYYVGLSAQHTPAMHCVGVAWSLTPAGPFTDLGPIQAEDGTTDLAGRPPGCGDAGGYSNIDPAPFVDDDGSVYLYVSTGRRCLQPTTGSCPYEPAISVLPLAGTPIKAVSERKPLFGATPNSWEQEPGHAAVVENPWMEKRGTTYYLFYSGGEYRASYGMGYATATSAMGGTAHSSFAKSALNPILPETAAVLSPGGGSVTAGPDGGSWLVYHGRAGDYTQPRTLRIDPLFWSGSSVMTPGPTTGPQTVPPVDGMPPETVIDSGPSGTTASTAAEFTFSSSDAGSSFECGLDGGAFESCSSAKGYTALSDGSHLFLVRAIDSFGNADPTPASRAWRVDTVAPEAAVEPATSPLADLTPPAFGLGAVRTVKAHRMIRVIVRATSEDLWVSVSGKVSIQGVRGIYGLKGPGDTFIVRGAQRTLTLRIPRRTLLAVRRALRRRDVVRARFTVEARDAAGNSTVRKRTVRLTR